MPSLFFNKVSGLRCNFVKKVTLAQVFSYEFCRIPKNISGQLLLYLGKRSQEYLNFWGCSEFNLSIKIQNTSISQANDIFFTKFLILPVFIWFQQNKSFFQPRFYFLEHFTYLEQLPVAAFVNMKGNNPTLIRQKESS